ncbi:uncharacterized protein LOC113368254 [Ctenocephalides felis]|uniref:uncharacterized protein LOC113368254 n=1 Tax=Ctenocephalides felis TaxID=7515 RepID=UPI000E6E5AD2|nr:uncharacterized protein LOC113368254 [Ctenocephalides felis]
MDLLEPSKEILEDFNKAYKEYMINKTLLYFCKQSVFCNDKGLDIETKDLIKTLIENKEVQEYALLKKDPRNSADNMNLLGLPNEQINILPRQNQTILISHMNQLMKTVFANNLKKLNTICQGDLTKHSQDTNLENKRMSLHEELFDNYSTLRSKKLERIELIKRFLDLKNKLIQYDSTHAVDLLEQGYMIEDARITLLQYAAKRRIFKSSQAIKATSIVLQDIESEIQLINDKIKKLQN